MRLQFDLRQLEQFLAVAQHGGFRRAARQLNIAQPALSRTVRNLEASLGVTLIFRGRRSMELTAAGRALAEGGAGLIGSAAGLAAQVVRADKGLSGQLRLSYTDFAIARILPRIVSVFRTAHPGVTVSFTPMVTAEQIDALREGRVDAGFVTGPIRAASLDTLRVQRDRLVAVLPEGHLLARLDPLPTARLSEEPFVLGESQRWGYFLAHVARACQQAGFLPRVAQEAADSEAILGLVAAGIGVSLSVESIATRARQGTVTRRLAGRPYHVDTLLAWRRDNENPALVNLRNVARKLVGRITA